MRSLCKSGRILFRWFGAGGETDPSPEQGVREAADKIEALVMQLVSVLRAMAAGGV
ncbi:MAG: hypothetical protein U0Q18_00365 [Bryobacteraceae bacterium]